jgi:hypothetical protein
MNNKRKRKKKDIRAEKCGALYDNESLAQNLIIHLSTVRLTPVRTLLRRQSH